VVATKLQWVFALIGMFAEAYECLPGALVVELVMTTDDQCDC